MAGAETAGILAIAMVLGQGIIELCRFLINKFSDKKEEGEQPNKKDIEQIVSFCIKSAFEPQVSQIKALYEMHMKFDNDGTPIWYVPRSWAETNKETVANLYKIVEIQNKTLAIIERLERRVEQIDNNKG